MVGSRLTLFLGALLGLGLAWVPGLLVAQDRLVDPERPAMSPEGARELKDLQGQLIRAFADPRIEKNFLAAHKLAQLSREEINQELLHVVVESLQTANLNYRWYVAHLLHRISGENNGVNLTAWREWLAQRYSPVPRPVSRIPLDPQAGAPLGSGSEGHDNPGSVSPDSMPASSQLGHDPNEKVIDPVAREQEIRTRNQGAGRMTGPGVKEDLPPPPPKDNSIPLQNATLRTNTRADYERGDNNEAASPSEEEEMPAEMSRPAPGSQ